MSLLEVFYTFFKKKFHILTSHVSCGLAVKKNPNKLHQDCFKAIIFLACKKVESGASKNLNLNYSFSVDYSIFFLQYNK